MTKKEIEALLEGTRKGPWHVGEQEISEGALGNMVIYPVKTGTQLGICLASQFTSKEDFNLIAAAPLLAKQCLELMEENEVQRTVLKTARSFEREDTLEMIERHPIAIYDTGSPQSNLDANSGYRHALADVEKLIKQRK